MKLSKSKLALAKVINENGGWVDGAKFSSQDKDGNEVCFYSNSKPIKPLVGMSRWRSPIGTGHMGDYSIASNTLLKNWHQTCISREEYYQAYPKADADGWIEWNGVAKSPVGKGVAVDVKMKNGTQHFGQLIDDECWGDHWGDASIIAYRPHKPGVKPEFCESVMRSIPEPEAKQTIEQLAHDYRNAKDYALRLQKDAREAAVKAESFAVEIRKKILELQELIG